MYKGFGTKKTGEEVTKKLNLSREPKGRLISWSPWPPANFKTRYPAFPFVLTILILIIGQSFIFSSR